MSFFDEEGMGEHEAMECADNFEASGSGTPEATESPTTYTTLGYVAPDGIGGSVTVTDKGDKVLNVVVGTPGKITTIGTVPAGQNAVDWLSGWGASVNAANGAGVATNGETVGATRSPPGGIGGAVSYGVPLIQNPLTPMEQINNVIKGARDFVNDAMGIPGTMRH